MNNMQQANMRNTAFDPGSLNADIAAAAATERIDPAVIRRCTAELDKIMDVQRITDTKRRLALQVAELGRDYPDMWHYIEDIRRERHEAEQAKDPTKYQKMFLWPDQCFIPMAAMQQYLHHVINKQMAAGQITTTSMLNRMLVSTLPDQDPDGESKMLARMDCARSTALATWRYSKGIYRFDPDIYAALMDTDMSGNIPASQLRRLPEWCVYVETPGLHLQNDAPVHGFYAYITSDIFEGGAAEVDALCVTMDVGINESEGRQPLPFGRYLSFSLPLVDGPSIEEALDSLKKSIFGRAAQDLLKRADPEMFDTNVVPVMRHAMRQVASLLLYICLTEPDITGHTPADVAVRPTGKQTKKGWRFFAPDNYRVFNVGKATGEALRRAGGGAKPGGKVSPHIRRSHFHGYWRGSRSAEKRDYYVKWLPPILVGDKSEDEPQPA